MNKIKNFVRKHRNELEWIGIIVATTAVAATWYQVGKYNYKIVDGEVMSENGREFIRCYTKGGLSVRIYPEA